MSVCVNRFSNKVRECVTRQGKEKFRFNPAESYYTGNYFFQHIILSLEKFFFFFHSFRLFPREKKDLTSSPDHDIKTCECYFKALALKKKKKRKKKKKSRNRISCVSTKSQWVEREKGEVYRYSQHLNFSRKQEKMGRRKEKDLNIRNVFLW